MGRSVILLGLSEVTTELNNHDRLMTLPGKGVQDTLLTLQKWWYIQVSLGQIVFVFQFSIYPRQKILTWWQIIWSSQLLSTWLMLQSILGDGQKMETDGANLNTALQFLVFTMCQALR